MEGEWLKVLIFPVSVERGSGRREGRGSEQEKCHSMNRLLTLGEGYMGIPLTMLATSFISVKLQKNYL